MTELSVSKLESERKKKKHHQHQPIWQGTVKGERRQGRQKKRWEDNIRELTGVEFAMAEVGCENICGSLTTLRVKG